MTLFEGFGDFGIPPFGADRNLDVVEEEILKRQLTPGVQQAILDRHKTAPVEIHGDNRFAKPLLPFTLDTLRIGAGARFVKPRHQMTFPAIGRAAAALVLLAAAARASFVAADLRHLGNLLSIVRRHAPMPSRAAPRPM